MAPSVGDLSSLQKKKNESFKEYAQRWKALAARFTNPLPEKELTHTFINSLEEPFFSHLVRYTSASFSEIVLAGICIDNALLSEKLLT